MTFVLDPAFSATAEHLGDLALCHTRLQRDARYPWIVLTPRVPDAVELEDLAPIDREQLMREIVLAGAAVRAAGQATGLAVAKLNVGQLGNITRQLHVHVVGRRPGDPAWPGPVWGQGEPLPYGPADLEQAVAAARRALAL